MTLGALLLALHAWLVYAPCDDTYIFLVYARSWLEGDGPTYNGARVEGFTSPLWVALLTILGALGVPLPAAASLASGAAGVALLAASWVLARAAGLPVAAAAAVVLLLAATGDIAFYAANGMETLLFAALVTASLALALAPEPRHALRSWRLPAILALLVWARPDGALVAACVLASLGLRARAPAATLRPGVLLVALLLPLAVARWAYYGDLLPNTFYAKAGSGPEAFGLGLRYLGAHAPRLLAVLVPGLALALARPAALRPCLPLLAAIGLWVLYVVAIGGDWLVGARLLVPVLPALVVVCVAPAAALPGRWLAAGAAVVAAALLVGYHADAGIRTMTESWRRSHPERREIAARLRRELGPDGVVALNSAGTIPYYSRLATIDMLGLNDRHIARRGRRRPGLPPGHQRGDGAYVLAREPDVVLFGSHGAREATLLVSDEEIFASDEFQRRYRPWKLGARSWGWRRLPHDAPDAAPGPSGDDLQSGPGTR